MDKKWWIIGIGGSDTDDVDMYKFYGTKEEIKKCLLEKVINDQPTDNNENDYNGWQYGTDNINDIVERPNGSLYAYNCYTDNHTDYVALPLNKIIELEI